MIEFLAFALPAGVVAVVSAFIDRRLEARRKGKLLGGGSVTGSLQSSGAGLGTGIGNAYNAIPMGKRSKNSAQFLEWINGTFNEDEPVRLWLNSLPEKEMKPLLKKLQAHCSQRGFELSWLVGNHLNRNSELIQAAAKTVWHFCGASQQAADAQGDIAAFKALQELRRKPGNRANRKLGEALMVALSDKGLIEMSPVQYLAASNREQKRFLLQSVRKAELENSDAFYQILRSVVNGTAMPDVVLSQPTEKADNASSQGLGSAAAVPA